MFRKLVSLDEAKQIFQRQFTVKRVGIEQVPLSEAHDRVLAKDAKASLDAPPFNRSTVDGYAVRAPNTFGANEEHPATLRLLGRMTIGQMPKTSIEEGTTVQIPTGAPLPSGADAVVMMEYIAQKNNVILVYRPVSNGENVMQVGSDIRMGETALEKDTTLGSRDLGVLAALGYSKVDVYKRPKVAVISTGPEIVEPGEPLLDGKTYDINTYTLSAAVQECGGQPTSYGIVPDKKDELQTAVRQALHSTDIVITSGGVSVGSSDVIPEVLNTLGDPGVIISGIAIKPGKPTTVAVIGGKPVFSLPGHPTSSLFVFHILVRPVILRMAGHPQETLPALRATIAEKMFQAKGRRTFAMVNLSQDKTGEFLAQPVLLGISGAITTISRADGFVVIPERRQFLNAGEKVTVHLFEPLPSLSSFVR